MTLEEILSIDNYCNIHQISRRQRLYELHLTEGMYYSSKRRLLAKGVLPTNPSTSFVKLSPSSSPSSSSSSSSSCSFSSIVSSLDGMNIEVVYPTGTSVLLRGAITVAHLQTILSALSSHVPFK